MTKKEFLETYVERMMMENAHSLRCEYCPLREACRKDAEAMNDNELDCESFIKSKVKDW